MRLLTLLISLVLPLSATGAEIMIHDAYARVSSPAAKSGAAFMEIINHGGTDDRLIGVNSEIAARTELHTHIEAENGVMQMRHVEDGFEIPAGGSHLLARGGDHVMLMGLSEGLSHGDRVTVTLTFEQAGEMTIDIPVDLERQPDHGGHSHSN